MVDRADSFLAGRSLTAVIVIALVVSAFTGMFIVGKQATASGDLIVDDETYVIQGVDQLVDGNVVVTNGELKIIDGSLSIISNFDERYSITIGSGGVLTMDHGVLTTYLDQIRPWAELDLIVENGGEVIATNGSMLMFPGSVTLDNGAVMTLRDSSVTNLPDGVVNEFVVGSPDMITYDSADDGPSITVTDSTLKLFEAAIDEMPEFATDGQPASNLTLNGDSTLLSVNSYLGVDFVPNDWELHNMLEVNDNSQVYLYGTHFEPYVGDPAGRAPAYVASSVGANPAFPDDTRPGDTTIGEDVGALEAVDSWLYVVDDGQMMELESWDVGGLGDATSVSSATLLARYSVGSSYAGNDAIGYRSEGAGSYTATTIQPSSGDAPGTVATFTLNPAVIGSVGDIRTMDLQFDNNGGDTVQFENIWVVFSVGGDLYIYRWLNATVADEYGVPIPNATISAVFTGPPTLAGQEAYYYTPLGLSTAPDADVLAYMGETVETYRTTKDGGRAVIPYLTDMSDGTSDSWFVGTYAITGSTEIDSVVYSSTEAFSLTPYPAMEEGDQSSTLKVEITGLSVPSPDISKWLVVPYEIEGGSLVDTLVIEDMSYYHAGDVIVASDGELTVIDSSFLLVQEYANQRTIYVDGNGVLRFENAVVESALPIDIIVQGSGTLELVSSTMTGVNILAREDATVMLDRSDVDGEITTSWNSRADIAIYDCALTSSPILSGYTVGSFTNTSVPSIIVEDDAIGLIYRWIHVTILDGNGKPLPEVSVFARFLINESYWTYSLSDSSGVARLNCLGTILTEMESTFVGNYRVNATYWYNSVPYESDNEISVGVSPYTEPLGMNATYAVLTVSTALPDLEIDTLTGVVCTPESPMYEEMATITANVENTGVSVAYNVLVNYSEYGSQFASILCPRILPGETVQVNATWFADYPLDPEEHSIKVTVDEGDAINEIDDSPAVGYLWVTVLNLPDLEVSLDLGAGTVPTAPVVDSVCEIYARVFNGGTNTANDVPVAFYNASLDMVAPENLIGTTTIDEITPGQTSAMAYVNWTPEITGTHIITVIVNEDLAILERDTENNNVSFEVQVYDYPDLELTDFEFVTGLSTVASGDEVVVKATIKNLEPAPIVNPKVALYIDDSTEPLTVMEVIGTFFEGSNAGVAEFTYTAPEVSEDTQILISLVANPDRTYMEQTYSNNEVNGTLTVTDVRPDLYVTGSSISVTYEGNNVTGQTFGRTVTIVVEVENLGPRPVLGVKMEVGVKTPEIANYTIDVVTIVSVPAGGATEVEVEWTVNLTVPDTYSIWAYVDPDNTIGEPDDTNNFAAIDFTVDSLALTVSFAHDSNEYEAGATIVITITVQYSDGLLPVANLPYVVAALYDSSGGLIEQTRQDPLTTSSGGAANFMIEIPSGLTSGQYTIGVDIQGTEYQSEPFSITGEGDGGGIPLLIWILVIAIIVIVVVGFTLYTYVYGLGKLVECGECGSFVPAASKRCPKCGVEFEAGTMKCSECGQWVPSSATECPNCGVKFVGEPEGEDLDYLDRMRAEYESMTSEYRELAKEELGKKFSDKRFETWWKAQPTYVSFEDWLAKEEEKRKEGPIPCKVCGTLNPREATVCHKCGTIFAPAEEVAEQPQEEAAEVPLPPPRAPPQRPPAGGAGGAGPAPKTVVRRPIDRKVVPKKIIRAPVDKDEQGDK